VTAAGEDLPVVLTLLAENLAPDRQLSEKIKSAVDDARAYKKWPILDLLSLSAEVSKAVGISREFPLLPRSRIGPLCVKWRTRDVPDAVQLMWSPLLVSKVVSDSLSQQCLSGLRFCEVKSSGITPRQELVELVFAGVADHAVSDDEISLLQSFQRGDDRRSLDLLRCPTCGLFRGRGPFEFNHDRITTHEDFFVMRDFGGNYVSQHAREQLERFLPGSFEFKELVEFDPDSVEEL
jgi:hypothetical protein